jgi:mono/diheme cytochrome c family protein
MIILKKIVAGLIVLGLIALGALYWLGTRDDDMPVAQAISSENSQRIEHGRYLALAANCVGCHTANGGQPYAGGAALPTPYGTFYGPNITPDRQYGIGDWTAGDFWRALHNGKGRDGKLLYPAFPFTNFTQISRQDSDDLYAYFRTVPAIATPNRDHELDFPYNQRILMSIWRAFYFRPGTPQPDTGESQLLMRGRYLVEGLAHCAACHAPRGFLGASDLSQGMSGGVIPVQDWYAPPLTNDAIAGLGKWSVQDIAALLKTGVSARSSVSGPMAEVIYGSTQHLTDGDLLAIGTYLKSLPATPPTLQAAPADVSQAMMSRGEKIYKDECIQCHKASGNGATPAWPPLVGNLGVVAPTPVNALRMVLDGGFAPATAGNPRPHGMPPFGQHLNDSDIAAVVTYIRNSWGNTAGGVTALEAKNARRSSMAQ